MASQDFDATAAPADLVAGLSLAVGTKFTVHNTSTVATAFFREAAVAPAPNARAFRVEASGAVTIRAKAAGDKIFVWTDDPGGCPLIVSEAV